MKKLSFILCVFISFFSLLGAKNSIVPVVHTKGKAVPGESFGATRGLPATSTEEVLEVEPEPEPIIIPESEGGIDPLASGITTPDGEVTPSKGRALSDVLDSLYISGTNNMGCEWSDRYLYIIRQAFVESDSATVLVFDPEDGSIIDSWKLPFTGFCMGITFVNNSMYVCTWTTGTIRKVNPNTHVLIATYSAPGGTDVRGITSDGTNLYVVVPSSSGSADSVHLIDTLGSSLNSWHIGSFTNFVMGLAYASPDTAIWMVDALGDSIFKVDLNGPSAVELEGFVAPTSYTPEGIAFDGSDLWYTTFEYDMIIRIDGGYSRSRIALFQDNEPWGIRAIKEILYDNGIPFKVFGTADIGSADLSIYTKAIVPSTQDREMFDSIAVYRNWWENWINDGGVLEINCAVFVGEAWDGLIMPGGFSSVYSYPLIPDIVNIVSSWHPMVNEPYYIHDDSLDGWNSSTHGYLTDLTDFYTVLVDDSNRAVLAIKRFGDGGIIASTQTLEWAWYHGYCPILENVIKYWQYGVSTNVLFALADIDQPWLKNALISRDSLIGNIDYMDVGYYTPYTPTLNDLNMYDVVLTRPNGTYSDSVATGDTLAAYVDQGGRVVLGAACWFGPPHSLAGAIMDPAYSPFYMVAPGNHYFYANLGWYDATHPMMDGITTLSEWIRDSVGVNPGADTVAKYDDSEYLLAYRTLPSDGVVVGYNVFFGDTLVLYTTGQAVKLLSNIINWSAAYSGIEITERGDGFAILEISNPILRGNEWLTLSIDSPTTADFKIINLAGMVISSKSLDYTTPGVKRVDFDVSELPSGLYFLSVKTQEGDAVKKALVIK